VRLTQSLESEEIQDGWIGTVAGETAILMADSYASESMIDNSIDVSGLEKMTDDYLLLKGFGGSAGERVGEMYKVPIEMRLGAEPQYVLARQTDLVEKLGGKCLIARLDQKRLGMTLMQERDEILVKVTDESGKVAHEVIELQPLKDLMFNMSVEPLNVLSVCDSMGTLFIRLMNKGFRVKKYYSVELDPVSREVVEGICDVADVSLGHDVMEITEAEIAELEHLHMVMATPECRPWGGAQGDPPGFVDGTRSDVFVKCCSVVDWCRKHHSGRQASDGGARDSRTRRFFGNMNTVMVCTDSGNPDDLLEDGWSSKQSPAPCIVAGKETEWPVWVAARRSKPTERQGACNELEGFMGMETGASTAFGKRELSEQKRRGLIGSAVCSTHYDMLLVSLEDFKKEPLERKMMALSVNEAHTDAFDMLVGIVGIDSEDRLMLALVDTMVNGWTC
jgi:hypothetical protein